MAHLLQDLRFTLRQLAKSPGFTVTAIFVLAIGLCASVAIFAFVDAALLKPLPYRDSNRLVSVYETTASFPYSNISYLDFVDYRKRNSVFQSLDVYQGRRFALSTPTGREFVSAARVTPGFFRTLGVTPAFGRGFFDNEGDPASPRAVLLSYAIWQRKYAGRTDILGKTAMLEDGAWTIIGILPRDFLFAPAGSADYWMALRPVSSCEQRRTCHNLYGVARLKDGVSVDAARTSISALAKQLEQEYGQSNRGQGGTITSLSQTITGNIRPVLLVLLSGAGLLLLIAAVNVAGLLQVRSESRMREISVRRALALPAAA